MPLLNSNEIDFPEQHSGSEPEKFTAQNKDIIIIDLLREINEKLDSLVRKQNHEK